jgi:hypothetical protein
MKNNIFQGKYLKMIHHSSHNTQIRIKRTLFGVLFIYLHHMSNMVDRKENELYLIEDLSNELFVKLFSYLNGADAAFAFSSLNKRFQDLINKYCKIFDFKSKSKLQFDTIFDECSTEKWKSLQLSNNDDTPGQIEYCFQRYPLHIYFNQLESLSLLKINPIDESILFQVSFLTKLISLKIGFVCGTTMCSFDFSGLKQLAVSSCTNTDWMKVRLKIKLFVILYHFKNFSRFKSLDYTINNCCLDRTILTWPSQLTHLKIIFENLDHSNLILQSLENLPKLISLKIYQKEKGYLPVNGQIWQELIRSSLPLLKIFKFYFQFEYWSFRSNHIKQIISSFSTPFYVNEKKWFVHCDIYPEYRRAVLYTIPFAFDRFTIFTNSFNENLIRYSTDKNNHLNRNIYSNVKTLVGELCLKSEQHFDGINILDLIRNNYFNSIERLHLLPKYFYRKTLFDKKIVSKNFGILLKNTPYLHSLNIQLNDLQVLTNNWTNVSVCKYLSEKIRFLKLYPDESRLQSLNGNTLDQIIRIFTLKCQYLSIRILSSVDTVVLLLRDMQQLYSLHVSVQVTNDEKLTMKWLEQQQIGLNYSNCHIVNHQQNYYFWFGKHGRQNAQLKWLL